MGIVRTISSGSAVVRIDDSCCAGLSAEEAARRRAEVDRVIHRIAMNYQRQNAEKKEGVRECSR